MQPIFSFIFIDNSRKNIYWSYYFTLYNQKNMKISVQKGFTLIELLVVITIIGILATGAVTVYTSQIQKARDTTRISDIKAIQ